MLNAQSVIMSYLLGSQVAHDFERISASDLASLIATKEGSDAVDTLLTALHVKAKMAKHGKANIDDIINFVDQVAISTSGMLQIGSDDIDLQHEVELMHKKLAIKRPSVYAWVVHPMVRGS